jgi:mRNA interferase MazF
MSHSLRPVRGAIWFADLSPTLGHEQAGRRPVLIVSADGFNRGGATLVVALPVTKTIRASPTRVRLQPPDGGLRLESDILCDQIRAISHQRLIRPVGVVAPATLARVESALRALLVL